MDREIFVTRIKNLPVKSITKIPDDHEVIEDNEGGVHFKITKDLMPGSQFVFYSMSVSGDELPRRQLIDELICFLGHPITRRQNPNLPGIDFVLWDAKVVDMRFREK